MLGITWFELVTCIEETPEIFKLNKIPYSLSKLLSVTLCTLQALTGLK